MSEERAARFKGQEARKSLTRVAVAIVVVGLVAGAAGALFYTVLQQVQRWREVQPWLMAGLPVVAVLTVRGYRWVGREVARGNQGLIDEIRYRRGRVSSWLAPTIILSTWGTHLCGGSAGAEGAALQLGGGVGAAVSRWLRVNDEARGGILAAGMAAGMAAVFGLPWAAGLLVWEILRGKRSVALLAQTWLAAWLAAAVCLSLGVRHVDYRTLVAHGSLPVVTLAWSQQLAMVGCMAVGGGGLYMLFHALVRQIRQRAQGLCSDHFGVPFFGSVLVVLVALAVGRMDCLGLGVHSSNPGAVTIVSCFQSDVATSWTWWWKLCLTALTLAVGLRGGEFTPLCFMGASLGNVVAQLLHWPTSHVVALGMLATIAAATRAPLACCVMAVELFGWPHACWYALVVVAVQLVSREKGLFE